MAERNYPIRMQRCSEQSTELSMTPEPFKLAIPRCKKTLSPHSSYLVSLLASMAKDIQNSDVNADSILEEHLSRIWQDSTCESDSFRLNASGQGHFSNWSKSFDETSTRQPSLFSPVSGRFNSCQSYRQTPERAPVGIAPIKKPAATNQLQTSATFNFPMKSPPGDKPEIIRCSWCDSDDEFDAPGSLNKNFPSMPEHLGLSMKHSISTQKPQHSPLSQNSGMDHHSASSYRSSFAPPRTPQNSCFGQNYQNSSASSSVRHDSSGSKPGLGLEGLSLLARGAEHQIGSTSKPKDVGGVDSTVIGYYLDEDPIPYRTILPCKNPTLGQFKRHLNKKGHLKFFFKKASDEFDSGVVHEEITEDEALLPKWQGKVVGKVEIKH